MNKLSKALVLVLLLAVVVSAFGVIASFAATEATATDEFGAPEHGVTDTISDEGSKLGHSFTNYISNGDATCTADGTKTAKCDRCDATDTVTDEGSKLAHTYDDGVETKAPTCTEDGVKTFTCACGDSYTEAITAKGHNFVENVCTACGTTSFEDINNSDNIGGEIDTDDIDEEKAADDLKEEYPEITEDELKNATIKLEVVVKAISAGQGTAPKTYTNTVSPMYGVGDKTVKVSELTNAITFRLPVHEGETKLQAKVYHNGALMGVYNIKVDDAGQKYVEITCDNFSEFIVEPVDAVVELPAYVVLPEGMDASNFEALFGDNTVTDGVNYYPTLQAAVEAVAGMDGAVLYCKPGADVGALQHAPVTATLTVYGNGAQVTGGAERDFDIGDTDPNGPNNGVADVSGNMTLTVKYLDGCGAWGAMTTDYTVNLVFENCGNMGKVFISGTKGTLNIAITDCAFEGVLAEAVYSNANGAIELTRVDFSNLDKAVNLNHKATGTQTVTITDCTFTNCGNDVAADQIPVRVLSSVEGGSSVLTVSGCTFTGTPAGGADILIDYGVGETTAEVSNTTANVTVEVEKNNGTTTTLTPDMSESFTNVAETYVATIGGVGYETIQAALAAAQDDDTIVLLGDVTESIEEFANVVLTTDVAGGVTITNTFTGWTGFDDVTIGAGVTLKSPLIFSSDSENTILGTLIVGEGEDGTYYHGYDAKTTIKDGGKVVVNGTTILRYNKNAESGIYVYGDSDANTVEYDCAYYIGFYSGTFYAEYATIEVGYFLLKGSYDNNSYAKADMTLDGSTVTVVSTTDTQDSFIIDDDVALTLKNGAKIADVRDFNILAGATPEISIDATSSIEAIYVNVAEDVPLVAEKHEDGTVTFAPDYVAMIGTTGYASLEEAIEAAQAGDTVVITASELIFAENAASIVIDKAITINGAGESATKLVFNSATSAFMIQSSNVTFEDMTIVQGAKDNSFHISINKGAWNAPAIQYSDITIKNITFEGSDYALCLIGEDVVVDGCTFTNQDSHNIIIYSVKGNTQITNNVFNASKSNNKSAILWEGGADSATDLSGFIGGGELTISGNTAYNKGVFFWFTNWGLVEDVDLSITENVVDGTTNKVIALYDMDGAITAEGNEFGTVVIAENSFINTKSGRPVIKEYTGTVAIDASANYFGSEAPDLEALVVGSAIKVDSYYTDAALTDLVETAKPVAEVNGVKYDSLQAAINAAQNGDTVIIYAGEFAPIDISGKNITIQGTVGADGELLTTIKGGNPAITAHGFNGTIKNIKIVDAFKVMYAEPAGNVTVDNIYVTGATYGLHLVAYSEGLTWTIQNSYMDLSWANSFGVSGGGDAAIVITGNRFEATNPYYPGYGALPVNTFLPNVTVENNYFGEGAKINIAASVTDTSKINISKNYHADGVDNAFVEDTGAKARIDSYYVDENMTILEYTPNGSNFNGYTASDAIWGDVWGNAKESFVIKVLDANGNVMGTTSLNNIGGILDGDVTVTWSLKLDAASNTDEYWTMSWITAPSIDNQPAKVELWVDGVKVSGGNVVLSGPDDVSKIYAASVDADGKITKYYTSLSAAIANGGTVAVLRDVTESIDEISDVALVGNGVTVKNTSGNWVNITYVTIGSGVTMEIGNAYFTNAGVNYIEGTLNAGTLYNANNSKTTVRNGGKVVTTGMIVNRYHTDANAGIYVYGDGDNTTVEISCADTIGTYSGTFYLEDAVVNANMLWIDYLKGSTEEADKYAQSTPIFNNSIVNITKELRFYKDATLTLTNSEVTAGTVQIRENATPAVNMDNSTIKADAILNLAGATLNAVLGEDGTVSFVKIVAKIGDTYYATLEDAFKAATEGSVIEILADVVIDYKWDCRDYATGGSHSQFNESVTINGNGHTIKFTGAVSDNNWNTIFRFEENAVVNNLTIDISEATGAQRVISAKKSLTVDGLTIIGAARYGIIFGEGASADDLAATEIVIKNSELTGTRRAISDNEGGKDVKSVVITDNTLGGNAYASASTSIVFNNNVAYGEVDLRSYAAKNALTVEAQGNTLTEGVKNYIKAQKIDAQAEFTTDLAPVGSGTWGGIDWELYADGTLIIAPTKGTPVADKNAPSRTYEVGEWRERVIYNSKGEGVDIGGTPYDMKAVKKLIIKEGVTKIGSFTAQFPNLTGEVVIPSTVTYIGQEAFHKTPITSLVFAAGGTEGLCIANGAFKKTAITEVSLPGDREWIHVHHWAFGGSTKLEHAYIPANVTKSWGGEHVDYFDNFNAQSNVTWAEYGSMFTGCTAMKTITFENEAIRDLFFAKNRQTTNEDYIVAYVGLTAYNSFEAAFAAAESGDTIGIVNNIALKNPIEIPADMTLTIEILNGKTLSHTKACTDSYQMINNNGNLTIKGNGKISFKDTSAGDPTFNWGSYTIRNNGTLVVDGCTIEHTGAQAFATHMICAIFQYSGSTTINGGTISTPNYRSVRLWMGDMTINGGTFNGQVWVQAVDNSAELTINGGSFAPRGNDASSVFVSNVADNVHYNVAFEVTGGTFNGKIGSSDAAALAGSVTGGSFTETALNGTNATLFAEQIAFIKGDYYVAYETLADAFAAAKDGETIVLIKDITVSESVTVPAGKAITLDLGGKTISGIDNSTKSFGLLALDAGADLTIEDSVGTGKITLIANNNRGWGGYSSVISVQRAKLTVNGGTIEHLGGTDMAYAIDVLTNTGAEIAETVINGGTIKSTYRAIRQFANSTKAENILTVNGGTIEGANRSIWIQNANSSNNPATLTVGANAVITGDVLVSGSNATAWELGLSVNDAALQGESTVVGSKLPVTMTLVNANGVWGKAASVASVNGVGYVNFLDALKAAEDGETVVLHADIELHTRLIFSLYTNGKNVTVDGDGHRFYASSTNWGTGNGKHLININCDNVTLQDLVLDCNNIAEGANIYMAQNIVLDNVSIINKKGWNADLTVNGSTLTVKNKLSASYVDVSLGKGVTTPLGIVAENGAVLDVKTLQIASAGYANTNLDGALSTDGTAYYTFKKLDTNGNLAGYTNSFSRLSNGYGYKLLEDATVNSNVTVLNAGHSGTIDLNGHTLTVADGKTLTVNGALTIANGTVNGSVTLGTEASVAAPEGSLEIVAPDGAYVEYADGKYVIKNYVASVDGVQYKTLAEALAVVTNDNQTVIILSDITENLTGAYLRGNITTENDAKVTITLTNADWVYLPYTFTLGENITLKVPNGGLFYYAGGATINGTVVTAWYYQRYAGTKLYINEPGSMTVTTEMFYLRYTDGDPNAGIYINGDNNDETVGLKLSVAYFYQGMISAKDANIEASVYWQTNNTDGQGSANLVLDNSTLKVTGFDLTNSATGNSTITLKNGSTITSASGFANGATLNLDLTSEINAKSLEGAGKIVIDVAGFAQNAQLINANMSGFNGTVELVGNDKVDYKITSSGLEIVAYALAGSGTEADPYIIANVKDLIFFRDSVNAGETKYNAKGVYVALAADIDLAGIDWSVNIGDDCNATFDGIFDGQNHTIKNLTSIENAQKGDGYICTGLFGAIYGNAVIKNLTIENATISTGSFTGSNIGVVVGFAYNVSGSIENVNVIGDIKIDAPEAYAAGAIVGYVYSGNITIENCKVAANAGSYINADSEVGGIVGYGNNAKIDGCSVENLTLTATGLAGGIAGILNPGAVVTDSSVENVAINVTGEYWINSAAVVVGTVSGNGVSVSGITYDNVTVNGATTSRLVGSVYIEKPDHVVPSVAAAIGDKYYTTFVDALAAAQDGDTITLFAGVVINKGETLNIDKDVTITYTSNVAGEDMFTNRGTLNISCGTIIYVNTDTTGSNVTVSTISSEAGSVLNISGGVIENRTVKADGSSIYSYAIDLLTNGSLGDVTATISGGKIYSDYMAIRQFNNGDACKNVLNVTGGEIYGAKRALQIHFKNNAAYTTIEGGKFEAGADGYALCFLTTSENISVSGGEFIGYVWYSGTDGFITGGTYSEAVAEEYCGEGYIPVANADGTYGVKVGKFVAEVNGVKYDTLAAAVAAAQNGDTVTILSEITENVNMGSKSITIDGKGFAFRGDIVVSGNNLSTDVTFVNMNFVGGSAYAIKTNSVKSITIENSTVNGAGYGSGFLYANKSTVSIVVKDVTVNGGNYGLRWSRGTNASFENVTMTDVKYGIYSQNYTNRNITVKNTTIEASIAAIYVEAKAAGVQTFTFDGSNKISSIADSEYIAIKGAYIENTGYFGDLATLIAKAQSGDKITVLGDHEIGSTVVNDRVFGYDCVAVVDGKDITIDFAGHTVTVKFADASYNAGIANCIEAAIFVCENASLTLIDSTANANGGLTIDENDSISVYSMIYNCGGKLTVKSGIYNLEKGHAAASLLYAEDNHVTVVEGGYFIIGNAGIDGNKPWIINTEGKNATFVTIIGGTFNQNPLMNYGSQKDCEVLIPNAYAVKDNGDGTWTVATAVAYIGGSDEYNRGYATLEEAILNAGNGDTVTLLANVASETITIADKNITLDLAGFVISGVCDTGSSALIHVENSASLTIKDSVGGGKVTFAQGASNVGWAIYLEGKLVLESGTIELTGDSWSIGYAVDVRPNAWGSAYSNPTEFVMNGGKIVSSDGAVRVASSSHDGYTGISASFEMNGGEIEAAWDGIFVQQSNAAYDKLSVTVNNGKITSALNPIRVYGPAPSAPRADAININLNGGSFAYTGAETYEWIIDGVLRVGGGNSAKTIVENGKVVVSATLAENLAVIDDYKWVDNGNNTVKLAKMDIVARVNGVAYESFDAAIAALQNGDTLTLEKDVTVSGVFALMQNVTVDLNGKTLTAAAVAMFGNGSIIDNGATKGKVAVPEGYLMMNKATYPMLPIWNEAGDGYVFVSVLDQTKVADKGDGKFEVEFRPSISGGGVSTSAVFKDGAADNGITFMVYVHFMQDGAVAKTLDLSVSDSIIKKVYAEQLSVKLTLTGATDAYDSYVIELVMISDTGVSYSSNIAELVPATAVDEAA